MSKILTMQNDLLLMTHIVSIISGGANKKQKSMERCSLPHCKRFFLLLFCGMAGRAGQGIASGTAYSGKSNHIDSGLFEIKHRSL